MSEKNQIENQNQRSALVERIRAEPDPMCRLRLVMAALRDPMDGCAWDLKQDLRSLARYTIEEAYEVSDAIQRNDLSALREELGDLLLQIVFQSQIAQEQGHFTLDDVAAQIVEKLIFRHPHVFGADHASTPEDVVVLWDAKKAQEKEEGKNESRLDGVTAGLPALLHAQKLQKKAAKCGFTWPDTKSALAKLHEELEEMEKAEAQDPSSTETAEEIGDVLFCLVNYARIAGHDAEEILAQTNRKFLRIFKNMEYVFQQNNASFEDASLEKLLAAWRQAKKITREKT